MVMKMQNKIDELSLQLIDDYREMKKMDKRIKELEVVNEILWEYISEKDIDEISLRIDKIKTK
tara:strand:+ start:62 stop:250 length:189 start_codon:yes stop_codon:yes gene_type:complete